MQTVIELLCDHPLLTEDFKLRYNIATNKFQINQLNSTTCVNMFTQPDKKKKMPQYKLIKFIDMD